MAHRSARPSRLQSRKKRLPRSRGEKQVVPPLEDVERRELGASRESPMRKNRSPNGTVTRERMRRRLRRKGEAHELLKRLPEEMLIEVTRP